MNSLPFGQLKSFLKILIGVQYESDTTKIDSPNRQVGAVEILNSYTIPWALMASATFRKPAMLAPAT